MVQKHNMAKHYFISILLSLIMVSCYPSNQTQVTAVTTHNSPAEVLTSVPSTTVSIITPQEALTQMYGKEAHIINDEGSITSAQGNTYDIRINLFTCFWDKSGSEKCLVITDRSERIACHGCGAYIDGATFDRANNGWKIHSFRSKIAEVGSFGNAPKGELIQIGVGKYAVLFKAIYANQGFETENLVMIAETKNGLGVVFELISSDKYVTVENQNDVTNWAWNSSLDFQPDVSNNEYYRIVVSYFGIDENGSTPPLQIYTFSDTKYVLSYEKK